MARPASRWPEAGSGYIVLALSALLLFGGASGPDIVRVRVPARDIGRWLPPGSNVRVMPPQEFEALADAARKGYVPAQMNKSPRLIRARHHARFASGVLVGESELIFEPSAAGPMDFVLDPWTPAVVPSEGSRMIGATETGKASLWVDGAASRPIVLHWELRLRPYSLGRGLDLGLPGNETTFLKLEIPSDWVPMSRRGIRRGPQPASAAGNSLWEVQAESGQIDLQLYDPPARGGSAVRPRPWITSRTEIDLRGNEGLAAGLNNWLTVWSVELDPRNLSPLEIELDAGLELLDVAGPAVRAYRTNRSGARTRLTLELDGELKSSTELRFRAHAPVPSQGPWSIPSIRPLSATWTEGITEVVLDSSQVLQECREQRGRRVYPAGTSSDSSRRLAFQSAIPGSVAELVLGPRRPDARCQVRGHLFIAGSPALLECQLNWAFLKGPVSDLEIELSPGWQVHGLIGRGVEEPLTWHSSSLDSGGKTRLHVALPADAGSRKELTLSVSASSTTPGGRGALELPRVRPVDALVTDETWLAWTDPVTMIQPTSARGLTWIDPVEVPGLRELRFQATGSELREALAWRWIERDAGARIERQRIEQEPSATVRTVARLDKSGQHLALDGTLVLRPVAAVESVPVWIGPADPLRGTWRFRDAEDGTELEIRSLEEKERARLGFPAGGFAGSLPLKIPGQREKTIKFHAELDWKSHDEIPLLAMTRRFLFRGRIEVQTPSGVHSRVQATGLRRLDTDSLKESDDEDDLDLEADEAAARAEAKDATAHALAYDEPGGRLELISEELTASSATGVVREAVLSTSVDLSGRYLHRLHLLVSAATARKLDLAFPEGLSVLRVRRDGTDVDPLRSGAGLSIPLHAPGQGPKRYALIIDYESRGDALEDGSRLRSALPQVGMPCLSFVWEINTPPNWTVVDAAPDLVAHDSEDRARWPFDPLGIWMPWGNLAGGPTGRENADLFSSLAGALMDPPADELTLAEWFSRWDSGAVPVIVDRLSLDSALLGPRSAFVLRGAPSGLGQMAQTILERHGLALVRLANAVVITTKDEIQKSSYRSRWTQAVVEAIVWGADRTDRFQTVTRWRGEPSRRTPATTGDESTDRIKPLPGWSKWRFSSTGWPGRASSVHVVDARARMIAGWMLLGTVVLALFFRRRMLAGSGWLLLPSALAVTAAAGYWLPSRFGSFVAGGFAGTLAVLVLELGHRTFRSITLSRVVRRRPNSSLLRRAGASAATALLVTFLSTDTHPELAPAQSTSAQPVLALFPYEGSFDPALPGDRVILRLADYERLAQLAHPKKSSVVSSVRAVRALHRIVRENAQNVLVESELELVASGRGPFRWEIPISSTREITAMLDGKHQPIFIKPGGALASLSLPGEGRFVLLIRRVASTKTEDASEVLSVATSALPTARVIVEKAQDGTAQGEVAALGRIELRPDQTLIGLLGPAERIEVRWAKPGVAPKARTRGSLDGLILWDIEPAGDRVRARFTCNPAQQLSRISFGHEAGLVLRSAQVSGGAAVFWEENSTNDEWILHVDPPLQAGATISLDCWMPLSAPRGQGGQRPSTALAADVSTRRIPRVQPIGWDQYSGSLGVRRPGDWTGRLSSFLVPGVQGDDAFVRAWGNLPGETLTLCGTSRFKRECAASLRTGPAGTKIQVKPTVDLQIESGRIMMSVQAEITVLSGHLEQIEAKLPENIEDVQVAADALTDWTLSSSGRLQLRFDPAAARERRIQISGWLPLPEDPLKLGSRRHRVKTPWIWGKELEGSAAFLAISSLSRPEIVGGSGLTQISSESSAAGRTNAPRHRVVYRVDDPSNLGELAWESIPPRVSVWIESQMTVYPDSAEWVAVLRYDVVGGALDAIHFKLPTEWAARANALFSGGDYQLTTESRGSTAFWTITPRYPIWGSQRFVLRSSLPLPSDRRIGHPEITPQGRGAVDAYVGIVNATGRELSIENSTSLQAIPFETRFQAVEFTRGVGRPVAAFRILREAWSLSAQPKHNVADMNGAPDSSARVDLADTIVMVLPDRSSIGRIQLETASGTGRILQFVLPAQSSLLWAAVDSIPVIPMRSPSGTWSIVIDGRRRSHASLIWRTSAAGALADGSGWALMLPRGGRGPTTSLVTTYAPPYMSIHSGPSGLETARAFQGKLARAEGLARSITDLLSRIDRSSGRDHEQLVSLLINHELTLRDAERSAEWDNWSSAEERAKGRPRAAALVRSAQQGCVDAVRTAGFEDDLASAHQYLGRRPAHADRAVVAIAEPAAGERIRPLGRGTTWIGIVPGSEDPRAAAGSVLHVEQRRDDARERFEDGAAATLLVFPGIALFGWFRPGRFWRSALALASAVGLAAYLAGPLVLVSGIALVAAGAKTLRD
jgi:hypothetical protein